MQLSLFFDFIKIAKGTLIKTDIDKNKLFSLYLRISKTTSNNWVIGWSDDKAYVTGTRA